MESKVSSLRVLAPLLLAASGTVIGAGHSFVSITVSQDGRSCAIQNRATSCMTLPDVLTHDLGVAYSASISVSPEGCGRDAFARAREVADRLKTAGFSRVVVAGFMTAPNANCAP